MSSKGYCNPQIKNNVGLQMTKWDDSKVIENKILNGKRWGINVEIRSLCLNWTTLGKSCDSLLNCRTCRLHALESTSWLKKIDVGFPLRNGYYSLPPSFLSFSLFCGTTAFLIQLKEKWLSKRREREIETCYFTSCTRHLLINNETWLKIYSSIKLTKRIPQSIGPQIDVSDQD